MERVPTYRPVAKPTRKLHPWSFCGDEGTLLLEALTRKCLKVLDVKFESTSSLAPSDAQMHDLLHSCNTVNCWFS